ncbi:MAG: protein phosphatase CheZ [Gammaproteobacteria bacterium]|nr:protein phosphatase CheZ [Gammaproteobacteria bacterium]
MPKESSYLTEQYMDRLDDLTAAMESGDNQQINQLVSELTTLRETSLYQDLGMLTREIHDTINSFASDDRIAELAQEDIPDAKERLKFIVTKTDEAAHRTMTGAEETVAMIDAFNDRAEVMRNRWRQFRNRELSKQEFVELNQDLDHFLEEIGDESQAIHGKMTEIMLAQDYQDITGQMIRQVVNMVQEIEEKLVILVTLSGGAVCKVEEPEIRAAETAEGPQLPSASKDKVAQSQGDVDDLLASLGF